MKLATLRNGRPDGELVVVSRDGQRYMPASSRATLQEALEHWDSAEAELRSLAAQLEAGGGAVLDPAGLAAPLPRSWQWLDGSAFDSHGEFMQKAYNLDPIDSEKPLMYQGQSDRFYGPHDDVPFPSEAHGIDFEGEFAVIVDEVPMGTSAEAAMAHIKLVLQLNDWSLRILARDEMQTGFGWVQGKPACSAAPFALTPDALGAHWADGRVHLNLEVRWNEERFGFAHGGAMSVGFHELVAHAAATRTLVAGTIIGSGTVSNANAEEVGSSCIAERRGLEVVKYGEPRTPFMAFGDRIFMEARTPEDDVLFGALNQRVVAQES